MFLGDFLLFVLILTGVAVVAIFLNKRLLTLLLSSIFLLLVAIRLNVPYMYLMGTVLLSLPLASYLVGAVGVRYLDVDRSLPATAFEGEAIPIRVDVYSPLALFSGFVRVGRRLPRHLRFVAGSEQFFAMPGGVRHEYRARADRRGVYRFSGCNVSMFDPLGIFPITRRFPLSSSVTVYPTGLPIEAARGLGETSGGWLVQAANHRRGDEEGFYGTREYRVGDDLRRIHWRSSARHGDLVVVERERASSGRLWIALDVRAGSERGSDKDPTLERAVKLAVTLMEAALARGDAVGLLAPSPSGATIPPAPGESQRWRILDVLAQVQADGKDPLDAAVRDADIAPGSTVVLITGAPTQAMVEVIPSFVQSGIGVVAAPVSTASPVREPDYPILPEEEFAAAAEHNGGDALWLRVPVFEAPGASAPRAEAPGGAEGPIGV